MPTLLLLMGLVPTRAEAQAAGSDGARADNRNAKFWHHHHDNAEDTP